MRRAVPEGRVKNRTGPRPTPRDPVFSIDRFWKIGAKSATRPERVQCNLRTLRLDYFVQMFFQAFLDLEFAVDRIAIEDCSKPGNVER